MKREHQTPRPVLKWAGGKAFSSDYIIAQMPQKFDVYYETFFGGGAVFFELARRGMVKKAVLSDVNRELMEMYIEIRGNLAKVLVAIDALDPSVITQEKYLSIRDNIPAAPQDRAARTLFLNKTCFNGLYRVNKSGVFNVPWNGKTSWSPDIKNLCAASEALQCADLRVGGFNLADDAERGDVVYFDPTYFPVSKTASFTAYTRRGFTHANQLQLAALFASLAARRVTVLASNADVPVAREIYGGIPGVTVHTLACPRRINSNGRKRGLVGEILAVAGPAKRKSRGQ